MKNNDLRGFIEEMVADEDELNDIVLLEGDEFADGAIGLTEDNRVVYGYERLVKILAGAYGEEGQSDEEKETTAIEWIEVNTIRSLPYMNSQGLKAPLIIREFPTS